MPKELALGGRINWILADKTGHALCSVGSGKEASLVRVHLASGKRSILGKSVAGKLPSRVDGDLSADGAKLCFRVRDRKTTIIRILDFATEKISDVISIEGMFSDPSWSPDARMISYYLRERKESKEKEFSLGISELVKGTWKHRKIAPPSKRSRPDGTLYAPAPSPLWACNGQVIVFEARYKEKERGTHTYIVNKDGTDLTWIAKSGGSVSAHPNGKGIVYGSIPDDTISLWNVETRRSRDLFSAKERFYAKVSPCGRFLALSNGKGDIIVVATDGSDSRTVFKTRYERFFSSFCWIVSPKLPKTQKPAGATTKNE